MNSLEFIDKLIVEYEKSINNFIRFSKGHSDKELFINCATIYEEKLNHLCQIKTELEAWEVVKKNIVIDTTGSLYTIQIYKQDEECKTFEKALEVKNDKN